VRLRQTSRQAIWAADFARYLLLGLRPGAWHPNIARPNSPPCWRWNVNRYSILQILSWYGVVPPEVLTRHWEEYHAAADQAAIANVPAGLCGEAPAGFRAGSTVHDLGR